MKKQYKSFEEARKFVHSLGLKSSKEWRIFSRSTKKPEDIPTNPDKIYKNKGWKGYGDWLGTGEIATFNKKFRNFEDARNFVHSLNLKGIRAWALFCKSGKKPEDIPHNASRHYKNNGWISWGDWLGTNMIRPKDRVYWSFEKAREHVHALGIKNSKEWQKYTKSGKLPKEIPANPNQVYKNKGWISTGDWLGTGSIASYMREYWSFEKARDYVQKLNLKNQQDWGKFTTSGKLPKEIPANPAQVYKNKGGKILVIG